jgi:hypothetical protein
MAVVQALKETGLIDTGAVPAGQGSADFIGFLYEFFDFDKSAYVRDRLAHGHSIGQRYCYESAALIRGYWAPAFKGRTLGSITRADLKAFSLSLPAEKLAGYKNNILNAGLVPLGWAFAEGMIPADIGSGFERYAGKSGKRGVLSVEEAAALFDRPCMTGRTKRATWYPLPPGCGRGR